MNADTAKRSWSYSLLVWLKLVIYVAPLLVAWNLWDPLDLLPYWICLAIGAGLALLGWSTGKGRTRDGHPSSARQFLLAWTPMLAVALGLGGNTLLDASLPAPHATTFLGFASRHKGPTQARFASWREPGREERLTCTMFRGQHCAGLEREREVVITTRRGALGWEWVETVAAIAR